MNIHNSISQQRFLWAAGFLCLWPLIAWDNPFFWDTTLFSRQADWFLNSGFQSLILPTDLDAGHPPFWSLYLALGWKLMGQHILVAHLLMIPILVWLAWELNRLVEWMVPEEFRNWSLALALAVPGLAAQASLFSNDLLMTAAMLGVINNLERNQAWRIAICVLIAGMSSLRGIMILPAFIIYGLLFHSNKLKDIPFLVKSAVGGLILLCWLGWHWLQTGWFTHPVSANWNTQHELGNLDAWVHNIMTIGFRFMDQGRIIIWLFIFIVWLRGNWKVNAGLNKLQSLFLLCTICLSLVFIPFNNPPGHRYFLFEFMLLAMLASAIILQAWHFSKWVKVVLLFSFISGHFWIYPENISKGWDSTLAHLSWSEYREDAVNYLKENRIPPRFVGTAYPLLHPGKYTHLNEEVWAFPEMDLSQNPYVLYSNLCNGVSPEILKVLKREWDVEGEWGSWPIYFILYRNPEQFPVEPLPTKEMAIAEP